MSNPKGNPEWKPKYGEPTKVVRLPASLADSVTGLLKQEVPATEVLQQLESVPLLHRSQLPEVAAIYLVYQGDRLLYIGRTGNLKQRWMQHHRQKQFIDLEDVRIAWFPCTQDAPTLGSTLIELLEPEFDGQEDIGNQLNIRIPTDLKTAFLSRAKAKGTTATELILEFMKQYLGIQSDRPPAAIDTVAIEANLLERLDTRLLGLLDERLDAKLESAFQDLYERLERAEAVLGKSRI